MHIYRQSVFRQEFFHRHVGEWPYIDENRETA